MLKIKFFLTTLFLLAAGLSSLNAQISEEPVSFLDDSVSYLWPTNASTQLSSTFAETRTAHLHAGIDIRTWGREGYRVFASRHGVVSRIGIGPHGYGHVIYMKHGDDSYTVYAHLHRFEPELQAYADSIRLIDYTYELDLDIEDAGFVFNKGDVIGYSGSTGVGPPHLHFEVRNPDFIPINPLLTNLSVSDDLPPVFTQLAIEHLHSNSLKRKEHSIHPVTEDNGRFDFGEMTVNGPVGLAVNVHDRANQSPNVYAVHSLKLVHESDTLFYSVADSFRFRDSGQMFLDRSYPILAKTRRGFQRLYRVQGNRLPFYQNYLNNGVIWFEDGIYEMEIIASDIYGNRSKADVTIRFEGSPDRPEHEITYVPAYPHTDHQSERPFHNWRTGSVPLSESLLASAGPANYSRYVNPAATHRYTSQSSVLKQLSPGKYQTLHTPDQNLWIQFPSDALYDTLDIKMRVEQSANQIDIVFDPVRLPLNRPVILNYILPERYRDMDNLALFSVDHHRNRERFVQSEISNGIVRARLNEIIDLRLKVDRTAPWVGWPRIEKNLGDQYIIILPTVDGDTGIDYRSSVITVNGKRGIVEYDPEKDFLSFYLPGFEPSSKNEIRYEVYDRAGNRTTNTVSVSH